MRVVLTGGSGYIGSHTVLSCAEKHPDWELHVIDTAEYCPPCVQAVATVHRVDVREYASVRAILERYHIDAVVHFAALKSVEESVHNPLLYHDNNVGGMLALLRAMRDVGCTRLIFSSSATVYTPGPCPFHETSPAGEVASPYGMTKWVGELLLRDLREWDVTIFRYFNPLGAHPAGHLRESYGPNLMPTLLRAIHTDTPFTMYHCETADGTGVRDYVHVQDVADGHVRSLERIQHKPGYRIYNLGTGTPYSVLDVVRAFERVLGRSIAHVHGPPRPGDIATSYASVDKVHEDLGWRAARTLEDMCRDSWKASLN